MPIFFRPTEKRNEPAFEKALIKELIECVDHGHEKRFLFMLSLPSNAFRLRANFRSRTNGSSTLLRRAARTAAAGRPGFLKSLEQCLRCGGNDQQLFWRDLVISELPLVESKHVCWRAVIREFAAGLQSQQSSSVLLCEIVSQNLPPHQNRHEDFEFFFD